MQASPLQEPMRKALIGAVVAGALLVAGCGGDEERTDEGGGGGETAAAEAFCDRVFELPGTSDLSEFARAITRLNPPEELRDEFDTLIANVDDREEELSAEQAQTVGEAMGVVQMYIRDECGEELGGPGSTGTSGAGDDSGRGEG